MTNPLGRYYLYFAHHKGHHIRLAYADSIRGPWKIYEPGVLAVADTAFKRPVPEPDPDVPLYLHVASPDVHIDDQNKRIVMFVHGRWTDGKSVPGFDTRGGVYRLGCQERLWAALTVGHLGRRAAIHSA